MSLKLYELKQAYILREEGTVIINLGINEMVYEFKGETYGCCSEDELAVSRQPNKGPFMGVPKHLLRQVVGYHGT